MNRLLKLGVAAVIAGATAGAPAFAADNLTDFFKQSTFSGTARAFYFAREYGSKTLSNAEAFSLAGIFNVQTAEFLDGFSVGASFFTAHSLGANDPNHTDVTLMGPKYSVNALGQAFLQYRNQYVLVKAGDQIIKTPWMNDSDSRVLPATYQGIFADITPVKNLHVYLTKVFRFKSRTSSDYFRDNLYYNSTAFGDSSYGGTANLASGAPATQGAFAVGTSYKAAGADLNVWYYNYQQFANMFYTDDSYTLKTGTGWDPFIGGQYVREWKNDSLLNGVGTNGKAGNSVNALAYGAKVGVDSPYGQLFLGYDDITTHANAVGGGAIVSPYTASYATDPLYTTSMIYGQVERGPGHSWKVKYTKKFFDDQVLFMAAFARFYSTYNGNSNNAYADLTYSFKGSLKGLSLRDRVEDAVYGNKKGPGAGSTFIYNRVMVQYDF